MSFQWSRSDTTIGEGFVRIVREQIAKAISDAEDVSTSPERRVHEARRRCKKLRPLFRLIRPDFDSYKQENAFVRDAARDLSGARDARVLGQTLADLLAWAGRPLPPSDKAGDDQAAVEADVLRVFAGRMRELEARSAHWSTDDIDARTLTRGLKHTYRRGRWTRRQAERQRTDQAFHEWRKYAKYHWNQLGLLEECAEDILPPAHRTAGDLADTLGLHHDLALLEGNLDEAVAVLGLDIDLAFTRDAIQRRQQELEDRIDELGRQVFAETPKALKARFDAYLSGWSTREAAE